MRTRIVPVAALGLALTLVAGACGDDDDETSTASPAAGAGTATEYCAASLSLETLAPPDIDFETATPEERAAATRTMASEGMLPLARQMRANAAPAVLADLDVGIAALERLAETGDFEDDAFGSPQVEAALERLHAHDLATCGWNQVAVTATEYAFQGVPTEVEAGATSFELSNTGREIHEMVLFRRNDGVTESVEELLALPEEEVEGKVTQIAGAFAAPGGRDYGVADLTPGTYAMLCFVSEGSTSEEALGEGPPHFTHGMVHSFTVT